MRVDVDGMTFAAPIAVCMLITNVQAIITGRGGDGEQAASMILQVTHIGSAWSTLVAVERGGQLLYQNSSMDGEVTFEGQSVQVQGGFGRFEAAGVVDVGEGEASATCTN